MDLVRYYSDYTILQFQLVYWYKALSKLVDTNEFSLQAEEKEDVSLLVKAISFCKTKEIKLVIVEALETDVAKLEDDLRNMTRYCTHTLLLFEFLSFLTICFVLLLFGTLHFVIICENSISKGLLNIVFGPEFIPKFMVFIFNISLNFLSCNVLKSIS